MIDMNEVALLISKDDVQKRVSELAQEISLQKIDVVIGALTGAFIFVSDLVRAMPSKELKIQFVKVNSYGKGTERSSFTIQGLESLDVKGKNVLVVDDIFDSGYTLKNLSNAVKELGAAQVKTCALLDKPSRREVRFDVDYIGFTVENVFIVGYGLDCADEYRSLPDICYIRQK
ncbi:MAG: hypoxanthine phosphoribosyltransferase [Fibrobacter sp.]|nr:hypoxanthine phosphoribosyltransferase [Fibrobacter sp.]